MQKNTPEFCFVIRKKYLPVYFTVNKSFTGRKCLMTFKNPKKATEMKNMMIDMNNFINIQSKYKKPTHPLIVESICFDTLEYLCKTSGMDILLYGDKIDDFTTFLSFPEEKESDNLYNNDIQHIINDARNYLDDLYYM